MKKLIRKDSLWAKIRKRDNTTDVLYGIRDNNSFSYTG
jgi:hypothetical protein